METKEFTYGTRMRPAGPGCQPMNGLIKTEDADKRMAGYWSKITYNIELTDKEIKDYELQKIEEGKR